MRATALMSLVFLLLLSTVAFADSYLPLDSRLYGDLRFLEANGGITTAQLSTLPISRREAARLTSEAIENVAADDSFRVQAALARLKREFRRELEGETSSEFVMDTADLQYMYSDDKGFFWQKNRDGVEVRGGHNLFLNATGRFDSKYVGAVVRPEADLYEGDAGLRLKKAYLLANLGREEFVLGKESQWWGTGINGSPLLSNNAEPLTVFKISNSVPYFPFGVGVRGSFFITRLEEERTDVNRPILYGIRLDLKPAPWLELGLAKTALLGGEGRNAGLSTFGNSLLARGENEEGEAGDQRAGLDAKVVIPWRVQPITLSVEMTGEDQRNNFPEKWFGVYGIYLPRVLSLERLEVSAEYADNVNDTYKGFWYTHHIYTQGYTYHGRIIGHYIGADARDLFLRAQYHFDPLILSLSYENLRKVYPENFRWESFEASTLTELSNQTDLTISAGYAREAEKNFIMRVGLRHYFM